MTPLAVAVCPATPLLCPDVSVTPDGVAAVQEAARRAVQTLLASGPDEVVVVGEAPSAREYDGTWDWHGFGVELRGGTGAALPRALGVGAWLLDDAGWTGPRRYVGVPPSTSPAGCAARGVALRAGAGTAGLLVIADGSARRSLKAPGHLDERAEPYDDAVADALADADLAALAGLDAALGTELMAAGRAPWQVLAAAAQGVDWQAELLLHEAPYGVGWLVAQWRPVSAKSF